MGRARKLISLCVPVFNEEGNIAPFYDRVVPVMEGLADRYDFELLFTDNHSEDGTFEELVQLSKGDERVRVIRFSRNFGFQRSIFTNYANCRGDAAIQIDVDLQDPPELLPEFIQLWEEGYKVVYGVRRKREKESRVRHGIRKLYYRLVDYLSEDDLPHDTGDFRLIDRRVIDELAATLDQQPYLRGMIASMGFRQTGLIYDRNARERGESHFTVSQLVSLALDGILHHSTIPLRVATVFGFAMSALAAVGTVYFFVARLFFGDYWPTGVATIVILILFSLGVNAIFLGLLGEYVARIYKNVKRLPLTVIETTIDSVGMSERKSAEERRTGSISSMIEPWKGAGDAAQEEPRFAKSHGEMGSS